MATSSELVFVLPRPRGRFAVVVSSLGELWGGELPPMDRVDAVYDGTRDRVLICAHYDARALTEGVRTRIQIIAQKAGIVVLDGSALDDADRKTLVAQGGFRVEGQPALAVAMWNLARLMGGEDVWAGDPEAAPPREISPRAITANEIADRAGEYSMRPRPTGIVPPVPGRTPTPVPRPLPPQPVPPRTLTPPATSRAPTPRQLPPKLPVARPVTGTGSPTIRTAAGTGSPASRPAARDSAAPPRPTTPTPPPRPASPVRPRNTSPVPGSVEARRPPSSPPPRTATGTGPPVTARGSSPRVSTLRDVVAPHAIGSRPSLQAGRSAEDGTAPRVELDARKTDDAEPATIRIAPRPHPQPSVMPAPAVVAPGLIDRTGAPSGPMAGAPRGETSDERRMMDSGPITVADPVARAGTDAYIPSPQQRGDASSIDVRYLRSGRWAPARLRALSLKGAYLITAAFPRVGDHVHIALGLGDLGALVRGVVFHVTTAADVASTGTSGFAVRFDLDEAARAQLSVLLHRARARGVTITPPPPRGAVRLPVVWPVKLGTARGAVKGDALDVSRGGMFVTPMRALDLDQPVSFSAVLDDGSAPVSGRARVVREISESDAARRGLRPGFGLSIQEMGDTDVERWNLFLARVQRRGEHRILVGASPGRLSELTAGLASAGYAVVGGTDAGALVQLSDGEARPPDVAVIDASLFEGAEPNWLETLFSARKVPCVTLRGEPSRARAVVDRLLAV